jgi:hypothetical protein
MLKNIKASLNESQRRIPRPDEPLPGEMGTACMVGRVVTASPAIAVGEFLMVNPVSVVGAEVEGGAGGTVVDSSTAVPVYLVGPQPAQQGDLLICRSVQFRWVAERGGRSHSGGVVATGCPCSGGAAGTTPATLFMHVDHPELNVQNFRPATLVYGPTDAAYLPLSIGPFNWFSAESFPELGGIQSFRYLFRCESGYYTLRKIYVTSIAGSPSLSSVIYKWLIGFPGNNCDLPNNPFRLSAGQIYTGGDPTTHVTIDTVSTS